MSLIVNTNATDCLEGVVSEMTYNMSGETLTSTHSFTAVAVFYNDVAVSVVTKTCLVCLCLCCMLLHVACLICCVSVHRQVASLSDGDVTGRQGQLMAAMTQNVKTDYTKEAKLLLRAVEVLTDLKDNVQANS